jgi:hypothetical protein
MLAIHMDATTNQAAAAIGVGAIPSLWPSLEDPLCRPPMLTKLPFSRHGPLNPHNQKKGKGAHCV